MSKRLVVVAGPDEGRSFPLTNEALLLGRSRATDTHLIDPHISRVHCEVKHDNGAYVLTDFESPGGTFVNGKRVTQHTLAPGDLIRIGATHLQFEEQPAAKPAARPGKRAAAWAQALVGKTLGEFKVGLPLARGRSGMVFHARHAKRNVPVALKVLDPAFSSDAKAVQRFVKALKTELRLRHSHLLRVYAAGKTGEHCWVAKEYIPGESLAAVIGRIDVAGHLDWRRVAHVGFYLGQALHYAHARKMVHRNVTPQNVLLGPDIKQTKLADLMLASALEEDPTRPISAAGVPSESLAYMSPERTDGPQAAVDLRTDVYSLGATLYAVLAGRPPFQGSTVRELVQKIRLQAPPSLKTLGAVAPPEFEAIVQRMLAKRPQDRYPGMREFLRDLQKLAKRQTEAETAKA
jgi:serine/threonine protein kinase